MTNWQPTIQLISTVVLFFIFQITWKLQSQSKVFFYQDSDSDVPFNKAYYDYRGKNSKISYLERLESRGEGSAKSNC